MAKDCPKCEEGLPPWLATFADLMSLLMCFFVLLLSFAELDAIRFKKMAESMKDAFGVQREVPVLDVVMGTSVIKQEFSPSATPEPSLIDEVRQQTTEVEKQQLEVPDSEKSEGEDSEEEKQKGAGQENLDQEALDQEALEQAALAAKLQKAQEEVEQQAEELKEALKDEIEQGLVTVETEATKIIIRIQEKGSFSSGSADFNVGFLDVIDRISDAVVRAPGRVIVAGHTDDVPIYTAKFRSNWELSSARAVTVVHALLMNPGVAQDRVLVEGHADSHPLVANDTAENKAKNRRVELILVRDDESGKGEATDDNKSGQLPEDGQ